MNNLKDRLHHIENQLTDARARGLITDADAISMLADVTHTLTGGTPPSAPSAASKPAPGTINATDVELLAHALKREGRSDRDALREAAGTYTERADTIAAERERWQAQADHNAQVVFNASPEAALQRAAGYQAEAEAKAKLLASADTILTREHGFSANDLAKLPEADRLRFVGIETPPAKRERRMPSRMIQEPQITYADLAAAQATRKRGQ